MLAAVKSAARGGNRVLAVERAVFARLDMFLMGAELWAAQDELSDAHECLDLFAWLLRHVEPEIRAAQGDLMEALERYAPNFYSMVRERLRECVGFTIEEPSLTRESIQAAVRVALNLDGLRLGHGESLCAGAIDHVRPFAKFRRRWSWRRIARACVADWSHDAATFARACRVLRRTRATSDSQQSLCTVFGSAIGGPPDPERRSVELIASVSGDSVRVAVRSSSENHDFGEASDLALGVATTDSDSDWGGVGGARDAAEQAFLGTSDAAEEVRKAIRMSAACAYPVLLLGETGVGKELVARTIHRLSPRGERDLVVADCACAVDSLMESELFGHERGAFTGAVERRAGLFGQANGSTIFLDEINCMSQRMQAALLRVLESREYRRVGAPRTERSDFRVVAAAQPTLHSALERGEFRADLYYRLATIRIEIPPLRSRPEDAILIAKVIGARMGLRIAPAALRLIEELKWPGNVRQLRNVLSLAGLCRTAGRVERSHLEMALEGTLPGSLVTKRGREGALRLDAPLELAMRGLGSGKQFCAQDYARVVGVSQRTAQRHLARMCRIGQATRIGAGRSCAYMFE